MTAVPSLTNTNVIANTLLQISTATLPARTQTHTQNYTYVNQSRVDDAAIHVTGSTPTPLCTSPQSNQERTSQHTLLQHVYTSQYGVATHDTAKIMSCQELNHQQVRYSAVP